METLRTHADAPAAGEGRRVAARRAVAALFFFNGALFATWASRIPAVQMARGLNNAELGLDLLAIGLGAVIAMPLTGACISRMGSRRVCQVTALALALCLLAVIMAPSHGLFVMALMAFGANHGAMDVAMNAQAVAVEKEFRRPIMSSFHALWSTGALTGAGMGGLLAGQGLHFVTHIAVVTVLMAAAIVFAFPYLLEVRRQEAHAPAADGTPKWGFCLPTPALYALGAVAFCIMMGEGAMGDWIAVYLRNGIGASESLAAAGYGTFSITMATGRFFGDGLTQRWGGVLVTRRGAVLAACGLLLAIAAEGVTTALIGIACVGAGFSIIVPLVFSAAGGTRRVSPGMALASVTTLGYMGFLVGPPVIGLAAELLGLRAALGIVAFTSLVAAALAPSLGRAD